MLLPRARLLIVATIRYVYWNASMKRSVVTIVFVGESTRWGDPRATLLTGEHWERVRPTICQSLGRKAEPKLELDELARRLDVAYRATAARFPQPGVRIEKIKNKAGKKWIPSSSLVWTRWRSQNSS